MNWNKKIPCWRCGGQEWAIRGGDWTCVECGRVMTLADIAGHIDGNIA